MIDELLVERFVEAVERIAAALEKISERMPS